MEIAQGDHMEIHDLRSPDLLGGDFIPNITGYYYRSFLKEYMMDIHAHKEIEIMYVEQGECLGEVEGMRLPMEKGEFILINGDVDHRLLVLEGQSCKILNVEFHFIPSHGEFFSFGEFYRRMSGDSVAFFENKSYHLLRDSEDLHWILKRMVMELDGKGGNMSISTNLLFCQLILHISRMLEEERLALENPQAGYVRQAVRFIYNGYHKNITVEDVASEVGVNRSYFHRIFKRYTHLTPSEYLTKVRIQRAKNLLQKTNLPIVEVAENVGMNSQQYFAYLFKKETGLTPREYKKKYEISYRQSKG